VSLVTTNSSVGKQALLELEVPAAKIRVLPSTPTIVPTDADAVAQIHQRLVPNGERLVLFVGRLIEQKGVADLLEAFALLPSRDEVRLVIVGDGAERASLEAQADVLNVRAQVEFAGWLTPDQLTPYFEAADVFVAPSKPAADGAVESQGLVFVEAMAAGAALIGTRCGGIVDMVKDGETGLLVEPDDSQALAQAILKMTTDRELRASLVARAYSLYKEEFSPEIVTKQLVNIYEEAIRDTDASS
jgi:glycosyltransferase involved in cell wall biosynthesis